jgi:hypothetical protein
MSTEDIPTAGSALTDGTDAAETAAEESGGLSITDGLLSTEPAISVDEGMQTTGTGKAGAHAYIGIRKFVAGLTGMATDAGMPAIGNFALAGCHELAGDETELPTLSSSDDDDETDVGPDEFVPGRDFG